MANISNMFEGITLNDNTDNNNTETEFSVNNSNQIESKLPIVESNDSVPNMFEGIETKSEVQQVLLSQSEVQRSAPLSDAGPQVPRADPVDDPLGADAALSGEMQSNIYNRDRTLM